jgi:hypothetical protein
MVDGVPLTSRGCVGKLVHSPLRSTSEDYVFMVRGIRSEEIDTRCQEDSYILFDCEFTCRGKRVEFDTVEQYYPMYPEDELFECPPDKAAHVFALVETARIAMATGKICKEHP